MIGFLKRLAFLPIRFLGMMKYVGPSVGRGLVWVFRSREAANYTYRLTGLNRRYLCAFVASTLDIEYAKVQGYLEELEQDEALRGYLLDRTARSAYRYKADLKVLWGRRAVWYIFVRVLKPRVVIETGVDKGFGSCLLAAALLRNRAEGRPGVYYGTDINPHAGFLFSGPYAEAGKVLYGDSIESLKKLDETVDLFINDSDHSASYEQREYDLILPKMNPEGVILSDNAHCSASLLDFALEEKTPFYFFKEESEGHWYRGAGVGVVLLSRRAKAAK